jgi:hypothetical protein
MHSYKPEGNRVEEPEDTDWPDVAHMLGSLVSAGQQVHMPPWLVDHCLKPHAASGASSPTQRQADSSASTSASSSTSTSSSTSSGSSNARTQITAKFKDWTDQLIPVSGTGEEKEDMKATVNAVVAVLQNICKNQTWSVEVLPVGSSRKKTSLRGS